MPCEALTLPKAPHFVRSTKPAGGTFFCLTALFPHDHKISLQNQQKESQKIKSKIRKRKFKN
jgi:hypothetical protein